MRTDRLKLLLKNVKKILNDGTAAFKQIMTLVSQKKYTQAMKIYNDSVKAVSDDVDEEVSRLYQSILVIRVMQEEKVLKNEMSSQVLF